MVSELPVFLYRPRISFVPATFFKKVEKTKITLDAHWRRKSGRKRKRLAATPSVVSTGGHNAEGGL